MASRNTGRGQAAGGLKAGLTTGFMILVIAGFIFGWAKSNNINTFGGALEYFQIWTKEVQDCGIGQLEWTCETPLPGYEEGSPTLNLGTKQADAEETPAVTVDSIVAIMDGLTIAPADEEVSYERAEWKHWVDLDGNGCDTRKDLLIATGENVKTGDNCKVVSGTWVEPYANTTVTDASKLDIDHIVPLSWAAKNGGNAMTADEKRAFANDSENLFISIASENRKKSDSGPSEYLPPNQAFQCQYVASFVNVVSKYNLSMPEADYTASRKVLSSC